MRTAVIIAALVLTAVGCGDSPVGPTSGTRVDAVVEDPPASSPPVTGTLAGNVSASLWDGNRWIDLGSPNGITIPLQIAGRTTTIHGEASAAAAAYSRVRIVFQGVSARLTRGSTVGNTALPSDTTVTVGGADQRAEVVVNVSTFSVEANPSVRRVVTFQLRSQQWLTAAAVQAGRVEDAALEAAITASTRAEPR